MSLHSGRYLDRMEKRGERWAIAARVCLVECGGALSPLNIPPEFLAAMSANGVSARDRSDISYQRPLRVTRSPRKP